MKITMENFAQAKFDVFSMFNDQWALLTAGSPEKYNTMTIGWGTMGTICSSHHHNNNCHNDRQPDKITYPQKCRTDMARPALMVAF